MSVLPNENSEQLAGTLGVVVDEFMERRLHGEQPDIEDYAAQHPELADVIRQSLRALEVVGDTLSSGGTMNVPSPVPHNRRLGDFNIHHELGRGGMGIVYEAEQVSMGRAVALKILPFAAVMDPRHVQRFKNEVQAAALLQHQNIVPVYAVGCERGVHYFAMQFISGRTLAELIAEVRRNLESREISGLSGGSQPLLSALDQERLPAQVDAFDGRKGLGEMPSSPRPSSHKMPSQATSETTDLAAFSTNRSRDHQLWFRAAAKLMIQAAEALQHAHERGVLHRDIKPGNLMVDVTGNLWITDFGLARLDADSSITMTGDVVGTLRYMSPEQANGSSAVVDQRTDVYSLGATMYELLALRPAFAETDRHRLLRQIGEVDPRPMRDHDRSIPRELETIAYKAMQKNPVDRYSSAQEMANDLRRFLDHRPILAKRPSILERIRKWSLRHVGMVWTALAASLLLVFVLGTAALLILSSRQEIQRQREIAIRQSGSAKASERIARDRLERALAAEQAAARAAEAAEAAKAESDALLYAADVRLAADGLENGTVGLGVERLSRHIPQAGEPDRRGFAWHYIWSKLNPEIQTLKTDEAVHCLRYSPNGDLIATAGETGKVTIWRAHDGAPRSPLIFHRKIVRDLAFSDDGALLATAGDDGNVALWDVERATLLTAIRAEPNGSEILGVCFSRDRERLFTASDVFVRVWRSPWEHPVEVLGPHAGQIHDIAISPDGSQLAVASANDANSQYHGTVSIWSTGNLTEQSAADATIGLASVLPRRNKCISVAFSPDGAHLAAGTQFGQVVVWQTNDLSRPIFETKVHASNVYDVRFSSDGRLMATASKDGTVQVCDNSCNVIATFQGHEGRVYGVDFAPHADILTSAGGDATIKTWDPTADCFAMYPVSAYPAGAVRPSPRAQRVALAATSRFARIPASEVSHDPALELTGTRDTAWYGSNTLAVLLQNPTSYRWQNKLKPLTKRLADVDGDGDQDRVAGFGKKSRLIWQTKLSPSDHWGLPRMPMFDVSFHDYWLDAVTHGIYVDLNNDGIVEYVGAIYGYEVLTILTADQFTLKQDRQGFRVPNPTCVDAADMNNDGLLDLLCSSQRPGSVLCWTQRPSADGTIHFEDARQIVEFSGASFVKAVAAGSQRLPGLVAGSIASKELIYLRNLGNGRFETVQRLSTAPVSPLVVDHVDADGDGNHDLVVAGPEGIHYFRMMTRDNYDTESRPLTSLEDASWVRPLRANLVMVDATTLDIASQFHTCDDFSSAIAASRKARRIATVSNRHILRLWTEQGVQVSAIDAGDTRVHHTRFCPDGSRLVAVIGDDIMVYHTDDLDLEFRLRGHQNTVRDIAVSNSNEILASVSDDQTAKLWSLQTGDLLSNLAGHSERVFCVAFSDDDRLLATADKSGAVIIWDVHTGQELLELRDFPYLPRAIAFNSRTQLTVWGSDVETATYAGTWKVDLSDPAQLVRFGKRVHGKAVP